MLPGSVLAKVDVCLDGQLWSQPIKTERHPALPRPRLLYRAPTLLGKVQGTQDTVVSLKSMRPTDLNSCYFTHAAHVQSEFNIKISGVSLQSQGKNVCWLAQPSPSWNACLVLYPLWRQEPSVLGGVLSLGGTCLQALTYVSPWSESKPAECSSKHRSLSPSGDFLLKNKNTEGIHIPQKKRFPVIQYPVPGSLGSR